MQVSPDKSEDHKTAGILKPGMNFEIRFNELKRFKERFNHCNVPWQWEENSALACWVSRQRSIYKNKGSLEFYRQRIERLSSIGFNWTIRKRTDWDGIIEELKKFKQQFGHCDIPQHCKDYHQLGAHVHRLRRLYKKKDYQNLSPEIIEKLNAIGFTWAIKKRKNWDGLIEELMQFKQQFGHCNVSQLSKEYRRLGNHVNKLRLLYKKRDYQKLPPEIIEKLNAIGFTWTIKKRTDWEVMFCELKEFNEIYGRFDKFVGKKQGFINWECSQRKKYKKGKLSQEHYHLLDSIGFFEHPSGELKSVLQKYKNVLSFEGLESCLEGEDRGYINIFVRSKTLEFHTPLWEKQLKEFLLQFSYEIPWSEGMNCMIRYEKIFNVRGIERQINCPVNTIQKALRGTNLIPVKWEEPLEIFLGKMANDLKLALE
ncbi:MAG TPA: helicase associated domain-containing protein [Bacteroidales bacterium]